MAENGKNYITVYTDASFCSKTNAAGWACWIKYGDGKKIEASGPFREDPDGPQDAEMKAIANAIAVVNNKLTPSGAIIALVTDCKAAIEYIEGNVKRGRKDHKALGRAIREMTPKGCTLSLRWVKAHKTNGNKRNYVNNVVDAAAKAHMRRKRREYYERDMA